MKILHVTNFFKPSWESGGPARVAYELCMRMVEMGHEVTVYTTDGFKHRLDVKKNVPINVDGIIVYYFRNLSSYLAKRVLTTPYKIYKIEKEICRYDIIHIHEFNIIGAIIAYYAIKHNIPYVIQPHGSLPFIYGKRNIIGKFIFNLYEKRMANNSNLIIAITTTEKDLAFEYIPKTPVKIVPNGVNLTEYKKLPKKGTFKSKYNLPDYLKLILYLGRLNPTKGIDILVKSYIELRKKYKNIGLVIIGPDDGYKNELIKLVLNNYRKDILFTGFIDEELKKGAYIDSYVFVTPKYSGFPVTFLESYIMGLPVITTKCGDVIDLLNTAAIITSYDSIDLSNSIELLINNKKLRMNLSNRGKKLVESDYNWEKLSCELIMRYKNIVGVNTNG